MAKTKTQNRIEEKYGKPIPAILIELYERLQTTKAVCEKLDITHLTLMVWLEQYELERVHEVRHVTTLRPRSEELASTR